METKDDNNFIDGSELNTTDIDVLYEKNTNEVDSNQEIFKDDKKQTTKKKASTPNKETKKAPTKIPPTVMEKLAVPDVVPRHTKRKPPKLNTKTLPNTNSIFIRHIF